MSSFVLWLLLFVICSSVLLRVFFKQDTVSIKSTRISRRQKIQVKCKLHYAYITYSASCGL